MSDDPFDRTLHQLAHVARAEAERGIQSTEVDAALDRVVTHDETDLRVVSSVGQTSASTRRWVALAAAAAVIATVIGAAIALSRGDEQVTMQSVPVTVDDGDQATPTDPPNTSNVSVVSTVASTVPESEMTAVPTTTAPTTTTELPFVPFLPEPELVESLDEVPYERYLPDASCFEDGCAQIAYDATGGAWSFANGVLTHHVRGGASIALPEPWASVAIHDMYLITIGPDDVAYFYAYQAPESADLVGISIAANDAGQQVVHEVGVLDFSGDTDYVPTPTGLAIVGCCGPDRVRPAPDAELLAEWLDRAGDKPPLPLISFDLERLQISRDDLTWKFDVDPQRLILRGMPMTVATSDGGVIGLLVAETENYIVRGWTNGLTSVVEVSQSVAVRNFTPEGFAVSVDNDQFVVVDFFGDVPRPPYEPQTIDVDSGIVTLDLDWQAPANESAAARTVRANQIAGPVSLGERRTITPVDAEASIVVVTTEGFFDDSVFGVQLTVDFMNETIGWANTCQPDRGHQDYQAQYCT